MHRVTTFATGVAATALLVAAFLPWYRNGWAQTTMSGETYETTWANAWSASAWWTGGILLGTAAAAGTVALRRSPYLARRWAPPALATTGLLMIIGRRLTIPSVSHGGGSWQSGGSTSIGDITQDDLVIYHAPGRNLDVDWGYTTGVTIMLMLTVAVFAASLFHHVDGKPPGTRTERPNGHVTHRDQAS